MSKKSKRIKQCLSLLLCFGILATTLLGNVSAYAGSGRKIDVWDFGCVAESNTDLYNNNVTAALWDACANVGTDGKFVAGETTFGDLTITHNSNDRLYSPSTKNYTSASALTTKAYDDGYTANGMFYCNGTGGDNRRYISVNNVVAGDKIVVYMGSSNAVEGTFYFTYMGTDGTQQIANAFSNECGKYEFVAEYSGTYKLWTDGSVGKPVYHRVVRIPGVEVTGTIDLAGSGITDYTVKFTNSVTGGETIATLNGTNFSVVLAAGDEYTASLSGATGFGFTNACKKVTTQLSDVISGVNNVSLVVEPKTTYTYSGKITGFASDYDISKLKVTMEVPEDALVDDVVLSIAADGSFTATLEPDVQYTAVLSGVNDYEITAGGKVYDTDNVTEDITVALKAKYDVKGGFLDLPSTSTISAIKFTNMEDGYVYTGTATATGYSVSLRNGAYAVEATVDGYKTNTHVVVKDAAVTKDLMFVSTAAPGTLTWASDIYVGYEDKGALNYDTVSAAMAACVAMNPTSEAQRITVHIAPGTYREQITVAAPYVTLVNDSDEEVLLTWYYGIGYKYYSADSTGFYNPENAYDKFEKKTVEKWGCSTYVKASAKGFRADGITFEASFNRYITDEEILDGVEVSGLESIAFERKYGADVTSKAATERATAIAVYADNAEFTNCTFLGSQDTLFTGNANTYGYYKNCVIVGNTDYIFGSNNAVFDGCVLKFAGYSTGAVGGYVTAHKPADGVTAGYLFRNCTITGDDKLEVKAGYLGRPWGPTAMVTFLNTKMDGDYIEAAGWTQMSGAKPENANFKEYNTVFIKDGSAVATTGRVTGVIDSVVASQIQLNTFLGSSLPKAYVEENSIVKFETAPYVVDNGDINTPYPGHTLTVGYSLGTANDANDASVIRWYSVDGTTETLVKSSTAVLSNTYKITTADIGKKIKVVVIPETFSGNAGSSASYTVEVAVKDGYEDPSNSSADITLGDGINIFLAGDSTVKDYSVNGMYMNGIAQSEGSWGEFLQGFFDESVVKIQNYANGGRSTRNYINEGTLDKIAAKLQAGDYLFIQFGHNDCSNGAGYLEDRYVPLGTPDANGIYPVTAGVKVTTPSSLTSKYGDTFYSYDCGGTYKWYLQQYINVAKEAGAIPVLVTPVARMYFDADGKITTHHDSTDTTTNTQVTTNDAYVTAVKQLAEEENVLLIDAFSMTKALYEESYKADTAANGKTSPLTSQLMASGEKTHSSKLGGFISAALMALEIQDLGINISKVVDMPAQVAGYDNKGNQTFFVNGSNQLTAYIPDSEGAYTVAAEHWTAYGQALINEIGENHDVLEGTAQEKHTVWVIGDSTVCEFDDNYYYPRYGWGTQLHRYFDETLVVNNLALSGRSSKSFTTEANYKTLMDGMEEGDFLLIGFGHNDEKAEADRYTNPNGDYKTAGSFANSLYENYIKPAQAKGVTVIVCTPMVRRTATTGEWTNNQLHITTTSGSFAGGDYTKAIIDMGKDLNVPVIDLMSLTKNLYDEIGADESLYLHAWNSSKEGSVDNTHTNIYGATYNAYFITQGIKALGVEGMAEHIKTAMAPIKDTILVSNPDYVEPEYSGNLGNSELWSDVGFWKGTVFGDCGGIPTADNYVLGPDANGNIAIKVLNNKGKIASKTDGIAMYYFKVPASKNFKLSATVTVNSFTSNDQVSFGLMARDDMYVDEFINTTLGDYVAAGPLKLTKENVWNCFARKSGVLTQGGTCVNPIKAGDVIDLKIESNTDGYACTFGNEETITGGFDFKLTSIDSDYVYVGMYASRSADVVFSNVKLIVDGVEVTPENADEISSLGSGSGSGSGEGSGSGSGSQNPETGDNSSTGLYAGLAVSSIILLAGLAIVDKKRYNC